MNTRHVIHKLFFAQPLLRGNEVQTQQRLDLSSMHQVPLPVFVGLKQTSDTKSQ